MIGENKNVPESSYRISKFYGGLVILVTILFEAIEFASVAAFGVGLLTNYVVIPTKWLIVFLMLATKGVYFFKTPRQAKNSLATLIIGLIPGLNALPEFTVGVIRTIYISRQEDSEEYLKKNAKEKNPNAVREKRQSGPTKGPNAPKKVSLPKK